jgi:nuclear pore complex protein Nup93
LRDLNALNAQASSAAAALASRAIDTDIDSYLSTIQSQSTLALIADGLNRSARDFDAFLEKNVTMEWEAQRRRIYEHFGLAQRNTGSRDDENDLYSAPSSAKGGFGRPTRRGRAQGENANRSTATGGGSVFGASAISRSVIGSPSTGGLGQPTLFADLTDKAAGTQLGGSGTPGDRFLREKQTLFMQTVGRLNQDRLTNKVFPVLSEFANAELKSSGDPVCLLN